MTEPYVLILRKMIETSFYKDSHATHLALHLILTVNYKERKITFNQQEITMRRGERIIGRNALSKETGMKSSMIYRKLKLLENVGFLNIKTNNRFSIISLLKYDDIQRNISDEANSKVNSKVNNQRTTSEQQANSQRTQTIKGIKGIKDNKEPIAVAKAPAFFTLVKSYFIEKYKQIYNADPVINFGKDGKVVNNVKGFFKDDSWKNLINWYMESEKSEKLGCSLSICFSSHTINSWQQQKQIQALNNTDPRSEEERKADEEWNKKNKQEQERIEQEKKKFMNETMGVK